MNLKVYEGTKEIYPEKIKTNMSKEPESEIRKYFQEFPFENMYDGSKEIKQNINLFQEAKQSEKSSNAISLKKLCRYLDKVKGEDSYSSINLRMLFDVVKDNMPIEHQIVFNSVFIKRQTLKMVSEEYAFSRYKVSKILKLSIQKIAMTDELFS